MKKDSHNQCIRHTTVKFQDTKENRNSLDPVVGWGGT